MGYKFKGADIVIFGSSHATERHHFPQQLQTAIAPLGSNKKYNSIINFSKGGIKISNDLVNTIKREIQNRSCKNTVFVFILGGNNLRHGNGDVNDVISFFKDIAAFAAGHEKTWLVFSGLVPSPPHDSFSKHIFFDFNNQLKRLCKESGSKVTFFNIAKVLTLRGQLNLSYFKPNDVHLNMKGASCLAKNLSVLLMNLK